MLTFLGRISIFVHAGIGGGMAEILASLISLVVGLDAFSRDHEVDQQAASA